ncbi:MAG: CoA-binding protein [Cyclobacteriaceae bacterium]
MKKTVVIGATTNPSRYACLAAHKLKEKGHEVVPIGIREGSVAGLPILDLRTKPKVIETDTVTLYIGAEKQKEWSEYILSLNPKRIIFNPGAENYELSRLANEKGIETLNACTLVMLSANTF